MALCIKCGALKHGAFNPCESCGFRPTEDRDMAYSLALTDHYFAVETLQKIGAAIPEKGIPELPPEQERERELIATVRDPRIQRMVPRRALDRAAAKDQTNFIKRWFGAQTQG